MERILNFFPPERHSQIYLQLSLNLRGILSQRLVRTIDGGRSAAIEVLTDTPRVKDLIHKAQIAELKDAMEKSTNLGMQTFDQALYELFKLGKITLDEGLKNADSANNLRLRVKLSEEGGMDDRKSGPIKRPSAMIGAGDAVKLQVDLS
jgi:twitching motility protein PilU